VTNFLVIDTIGSRVTINPLLLHLRHLPLQNHSPSHSQRKTQNLNQNQKQSQNHSQKQNQKQSQKQNQKQSQSHNLSQITNMKIGIKVHISRKKNRKKKRKRSPNLARATIHGISRKGRRELLANNPRVYMIKTLSKICKTD
jgi:transposase